MLPTIKDATDRLRNPNPDRRLERHHTGLTGYAYTDCANLQFIKYFLIYSAVVSAFRGFFPMSYQHNDHEKTGLLTKYSW